MKIFYFLFSILIANLIYAIEPVKHLMLIGGGGEAAKSDTIFDESVNVFGDYYKSNKWSSTTVSFNGGHTTTESILTNKFGTNNPNTSFTSNRYDQIIEDYKKKLTSGQIKSGEQLMIYIDSHGAEQMANETSHSIATSGNGISNYNTLAGSSVVNLDKLKEITKLAKARGVKMAIIDLSCHSGNTIALGDENTCVVSATGPNHYGYGGGSGTFAFELGKRMTKGATLENIFLEARANTTDKSYPMISTPQNAAITQFEYSTISPYLYYYDSASDKLSPYILKNAMIDNSCKRETDFKKLNELIDHVEKINTIQKKTLFSVKSVKEVDLTKLKSNIAEYKKLQDDMIKGIKDLHIEKLDNIERIQSTSTSVFKIDEKLSWREIIASDYIQSISDTEAKIAANKNIPLNQAFLSYYRNCNDIKNKILRENPNLGQVDEVVKNFDKNTASTESLSSKIALDEKKLYQALYKGQNKQNESQSNSCKNFTL